MDCQKLHSNAFSFISKTKFTKEEKEDFAQEYVLFCLAKGFYCRLDLFFYDYLKKIQSKNKSQQGFCPNLISLEKIINSESDLNHIEIIADKLQNNLKEEIEDIDFILSIILKNCNSKSKKWALKTYSNYLYSYI